jgi:enolase
MQIAKILAEEILDSRGNPTVGATVILKDGSVGWSAVPSGASTGKYEAKELRDNANNRYQGLGVLKAVGYVNTLISDSLVDIEANEQKKIDQIMIELDGTEDKSRLGANAILAVSLAVARAEANYEKKELYEYLARFNPYFQGKFIMPIPEMNVMNGGKHANWATDIQEYMLFPVGAKSIQEAIRMNVEVYQILKKVIKDKGYSITVGDEGGFAPAVKSNIEPFEMMSEAIKKGGFKLGSDISFGIDSAASEFYKNGKYILNKEGKTVTSDELIVFYQQLLEKYPIISMEDIFAEDDWSAFTKFTQIVGKTKQIVGDDLYVTNVKRLQKGIKEKTTNSILIKLNQIGTLTETIDAILLALKNNMSAIISHRSGETEDTFIADLSVAMGIGQIKTGAPARSERTAKYNRLIMIEHQLTKKSYYPKFPF